MQSQMELLQVGTSQPIRARLGWEPMQASETNRQEFAKFFVDLVQATPATEAAMFAASVAGVARTKSTKNFANS